MPWFLLSPRHDIDSFMQDNCVFVVRKLSLTPSYGISGLGNDRMANILGFKLNVARQRSLIEKRTMFNFIGIEWSITYPDSKFPGASMGPTWVLSALDGPHVGPMNFAIRVATTKHHGMWTQQLSRMIMNTVPIGMYVVVTNDRVDCFAFDTKYPGVVPDRVSYLSIMLIINVHVP